MARSKSAKRKKSSSKRAPEAPRRSLWQRCHCGAWVPTALVTLGLFAVLELILALVGVLPANVYEDPFVGFSATQPLFVPSESASPAMVTAESKLRFFNPQEFPREKGKNTYRIFCLGGSTTFGRPYDDKTSFCGWLREMLPAADPLRNWEVINAGGISYASYRVALLVEELVQYDPDLFIIYTGHNEFLEKRTYGHLAEGPGLRGFAHGLLGRTRVYALAKRLQRPPEDAGIKSENTVLTSEVVTRLEKSVGPKDYTRDSLFEEEVAKHFRFNLNRMAMLAEASGAAVVFITPGAKLLDCSPFKSEHRADLTGEALAAWNSCFEDGKTAIDQKDWSRARRQLDAAVKIDDQYAHAFYLRGRVRYAQEAYGEAKADFVRARDLDVCPLRAPTALVDHVRDVAASRELPCVDFEALVAGRAEHELPGGDFFLDHVHPTIDGYRMIAEAVLDTLEETLAIPRPPDWEAVKMPAIVSTVTERLDIAANALALRNLAQVMSWAGKFEEARDLAKQAIELTPDDPEAHYLLAWNAQSLNDAALSEEHYRKVMELQPDHPMASLKLAQVLEATGQTSNALALYRKAVEQYPADPKRQAQLADLLLQKGDPTGAARHYRKALEMAPQDAASHAGLGTIALQEEKFSEAGDHFARALSLTPEDYAAHYGMGEALGRLGDLDQAMRHYARAIAANPRKPQPHLRLAWFAMHHPDPSRREPDMALSHAEKAVSLSGGVNAIALNTLALAYAMRGDKELAIQSFEEALQYAISDEDDRMATTIRRYLEQTKKAQ
jgi:tetratricopeptide (TPR) repeat protein